MTKPKLHSARNQLSVPMTAELHAKFRAHNRMWIDIAFRTDPLDPVRADRIIRDLYLAAKLPEPKAVVVVPSPFVGACAQAIAAVWWHLRKQMP